MLKSAFSSLTSTANKPHVQHNTNEVSDFAASEDTNLVQNNWTHPKFLYRNALYKEQSLMPPLPEYVANFPFTYAVYAKHNLGVRKLHITLTYPIYSAPKISEL